MIKHGKIIIYWLININYVQKLEHHITWKLSACIFILFKRYRQTGTSENVTAEMTGSINVKLETQRITVTYSSVLVPMEVTFRYTDSSDTPHTLTSVVHLVGMFSLTSLMSAPVFIIVYLLLCYSLISLMKSSTIKIFLTLQLTCQRSFIVRQGL